MTIFILGLLMFLSVHSVRIVANDWRTMQRNRLGESAWKTLYSLLSLAGLALLVWGFGIARIDSPLIWSPPAGMRHAAALLTLIAFVLLAGAYVPRNRFKARLHHPMILGVKVWALAHLLANGKLADIILFGAFLLWAVLCFRAARRRDRAENIQYPGGTLTGTLTTIAIGAAAWAAFAFYLHGALIGVRPFG